MAALVQVCSQALIRAGVNVFSSVWDGAATRA
jgi:hypothetical protein